MAPACIGLIFHGIGTPGRDLEAGEAPFWISRGRFASILDRICDLPKPNLIRISFDDGNLSDLEIGLPLLEERGLRADFFVLTGRIGQPGSLDVADIHALRDAGMQIGSHGIAHRDWSKLEPAALRTEVEVSRAVLEDVCGAPVLSVAIPFGAYNARVLRALRNAGYERAYSSDAGRMNPAAFLRPRCSIRADMDEIEISRALEARLKPVRRLRRLVGMTRKRLF